MTANKTINNSTNNSENNKRIAKNTAMLYIRMLFTMAVSLYTSRVVLNTLGVSDFGVYNVVGGVVLMFSFLNSAMTSGTQRFLSFELGRQDFEQQRRVFSMSINIHAIIALVVLFLAETIGLWFLNTQLIIPVERVNAANWVYQFSILSFMVTILNVPYNASIIAHEKMNIYAYVSIVEVTLKLLIVFMLQWLGFDKLKLYAALVFGVSLLIPTINIVYCIRKFKECIYYYFWDKSLFKTLMSYAGWNLWGNIASVTMNQGINILLNIFFGPVINAARGVAYSVNAAVNGFVGNFQMAMNPQIVKSYASGDRKYMFQLIFQGSKYSFFLLFTLSLPILIETDTILLWWLKTVPNYTALFCRLVLINTLIDCISGPLMTAAQASGKIKVYQTVVGGLLLFILPLSYLFLKLGFPPQTTLYVSISISIIALFSRLLIINKLINISLIAFLKQVLSPILMVSVVAVVSPLMVKIYINHEIIRFFTVCFISLLSVVLAVYYIGLKNEERLFVNSKLRMIAIKVKK
ncbi:lipopolysaccharide biosynthesis protein [Bacteroides sedimenti]|uniref:Lipopolysaccharide biosynthesis protein n=1 Tax=Bacteroides sedimenti TaxID=2136147 RepID=A0ABM8I6X8_9BACE